MKTNRPRIAGIFLATILVAAAAFAAEPPAGVNASYATDIDRIEASLVLGLQSDCAGLQASAAQVIRDLKGRQPEHSFAKSILPLMRVLKDENKDVRVRQIAALALHAIASSRGDYAIEREAQFSDHSQLRYLCRSLVSERMRERLAQRNEEESGSLPLTAAR